MQSTSASSPDYMLIFRESSPETYKAMSPEQRQQLLGEWNQWFDGIAAAGKMKFGHPLEPEGRVVSGAAGARVVDGPFAEGKEAIGGFFMLTSTSLEEATAIARRCPSLRHGLIVEVRQVAPECPSLARAQKAASAEPPKRSLVSA